MAETELGGYKIIGRLAIGGMAEVYQAQAKPETQRTPGEPEEVVLKRLLPSYRGDGAYVKQFVDEAKLMVKLRHPNVVRTYRCFKAGPDYLTVQELVSGRTLEFMLGEFRKAGHAMPLPASTYIMCCVLRALDYVHRVKMGSGGAGIVHRDVSPANVLLSVDGEVKLTDFGVAEADGFMRGESGALRGTLAYMSPEQVLGQAVDSRTDIFAAGILLWELFTNNRLFEGNVDLETMHKVRACRVPPVRSLNPEVPFYGGQITRKALFADRSARFQTANHFCRALELLAKREGWPTTVDALKPLLGG